MNYNLINDGPLGEDYGSIYQGGRVDEVIFDLPGPLVIVNMMKGESDEMWLHQSRSMTHDHSTGKIQGVLSVCIEDNPVSALPNRVLIGLVDACIAYLRAGVNLYIHCRYGQSRATYLTTAILMRLKSWSVDEAVSLFSPDARKLFQTGDFTINSSPFLRC